MATNSLPQRLWRLPPTLPDDLAAFERNATQFKQGAISPTQFQVFRVPQGVYEQRESGAYMLRVRLPAGAVLPHQLRQLAGVARRFGNGVLHVTTRQDIQIHRVPVESIHPALAALAEAGLSAKGGGGNTVRNITGCPHAGVCAEEAFDVTPHVLALTEALLADPQSFQLPRKFKIAFSGCGRDCAGATINDVGLIAKSRDSRDGFAVYVGGGLGSSSRVADRLEEFVPAADVPLVVEAIKRVFNTHGNRKDRRQARLRHLVRQLGIEAFRRLYWAQLEAARREKGLLPAHFLIARPAAMGSARDGWPKAGGQPAGFERWMSTNVTPQKQPGFFRIELPLRLGDISSETLQALADIVEKHGERMLRATQQQNFVLRWVPQNELEPLHRSLATLGLGAGQPAVLRRMVACAGAATCRQGICLSRGVAGAIAQDLERRRIDLSALGDLQINISGCPNACGRHPVADIGLQGAARRVDGHPLPHYTLQFGGHVEEGATGLAATAGTIPARNVPAFIGELLEAYAQSGLAPDFRAFLRTAEGPIARLIAKHKTAPGFAEDKNYYYDWGAAELFSLAGRGPGECGAGVLDLIEADLKSAAEALQKKKLFPATTLAARALLVTRGAQAATECEAFALFQKHFLATGLADARFAALIDQGVRAAGSCHPAASFGGGAKEVSAFVEAVRQLFKRMDATLQFPPRAAGPAAPPAPAPTSPPAAARPDLEKDFRGVACPLNYVKTTMALNTLKAGQILSVLLDDQGAQNIPESAAKDGHEILAVADEGIFCRVTIRKGSAH